MKKIIAVLVAAFAMLIPMGTANAVPGDAGYSPNRVTYQEYSNVEYMDRHSYVNKVFDLKPNWCYVYNSGYDKTCFWTNWKSDYGVEVRFHKWNGVWYLMSKCWNCL